MLGSPVHQPSAEYSYPKAFIEVAEHPRSLQLIRLWRTFEGSGGMHMGRDIPYRITAIFLPNLVVVEPIGEWTDARIRLAGSLLMERFGRDIHGMLISELYAADPVMGEMLHKRLGFNAPAEIKYSSVVADLGIIPTAQEREHFLGLTVDVALYDNGRPVALIEAKKFSDGNDKPAKFAELRRDLDKMQQLRAKAEVRVFGVAVICETERLNLANMKLLVEREVGGKFHFSFEQLTHTGEGWQWCIGCVERS
jgi:hypothetical protein